MAMSIQTNVSSLVAQENLRVTSDFQAKTIQRLTSGFRINSSGDDAAGLAVANKFRSDIAELTQGVRNANDGISQLQIVDGGLSNISKMLDRMKTLATQSASATFTGSRSTLNTEFKALIGEITRQATNVGLNSGGSFNKSIDTYIGGASTQTNAKVNIDLAGTANAIDAASLGISGASVLGGGNAIDTGTDFKSTATDLMKQDASTAVASSQTFTFKILNDSYATQTVTATLTGDSDGITVDDALKQLNSQLSTYGISATTVSADDPSDATLVNLAFSGSRSFSVSAAAASAGVTAGKALTGATATYNKSMYNVQGDVAAALTGVDGLILTNVGTGQAAIVSLNTLADRDAVVGAINTAAASLGMQAIATSGSATGFTIQSSSQFTVVRTGDGGDNLGASFGTTSGVKTVTAPAAGTSETGNALSAISALQSAVSSLGKVQGTIGAAQNKLAYAINLAQSQISNFSAAESRIRDADVAAEAANLTKAQVLSQASMAAMAQANSAPQQVLSLLRG